MKERFRTLRIPTPFKSFSSPFHPTQETKRGHQIFQRPQQAYNCAYGIYDLTFIDEKGSQLLLLTSISILLPGIL